MSRCLGPAMLALATSVNSAGETTAWEVYIEEADGNVHFYDTSRVEVNSDTQTVWTRIRYKRNVMAAASYQSHLEIDCAARNERTLRRTFFTDKNWEKPAMKTDTKPKKKRRIKQGSAFDRLSGILCDR